MKSRSDRHRSKRKRVFLATCTAGLAISLAGYAFMMGPATVAYWKYTPAEGDIIFQSLPHAPLVNTIEGVTDSAYSHCGLVYRQDHSWFVIEAFDDVETTPLKEFLVRGRNRGFAVYRPIAEAQRYVKETIANAKTYLGRPYDARYRMDDEKIYCSELIFKAFRTASGGQELGRLERLSELNWQPHEQAIRYFEGGPVPLDREMITPKSMAQSRMLRLVTAHAIPVYE